MGRWYDDDREDFRSQYPGRSTVDWFRPSSSHRTREHSPFNSSGIDPTSFRKNAFSFDSRSGPQPRDYRHYDTHEDRSYVRRDSDRYTNRGSSGGDKLSRDASRLRSGGSSYDDYGPSSSSLGSEYRRRDSSSSHRRARSPSEYDAPRSSSSRSGSRSNRFDDFLSSSSSGRHTRGRSPPSSYKYFSPDDVGRRSSFSRDRRPSFGGRDDYGSCGGYQTRIITPEGYGSSSRRGSRAGRFSID